MPTEYTEAPDDVVEVLNRVIRNHHPNLAECGAVIGILMARNADGPAVKLHGTPALATIKVVATKDRVRKLIDAEITIDSGEWERLHPEQQEALICHETCHLKRKEHSEKKLAKLRKEDPDAVAWVIDNLGRPKLGTVPADMTPGDAFKFCIETYGTSAVEFVGAKKFAAFAEAAMADHVVDMSK